MAQALEPRPPVEEATPGAPAPTDVPPTTEDLPDPIAATPVTVTRYVVPAGATTLAPVPRPGGSLGERAARWTARALRPTEGKIVFLVAAVPMVSFAWFMSMVRHMAFSDALTRLNNAESVIFSFDPHGAAIGFVYGPLPSALDVLVLPLAKIWPSLQIYNVIGSVETALFAAGTMAVVVGTARDLRLPRFARYGLAAAIGLHPIYLVYASNGMAEGINIFFLAVTSRYVLRWLDRARADDRNRNLLYAGLAVSGAYLSRIEPVASGIAVTILVAVVSFVRTPGPVVVRRQMAGLEAFLIGGPFLFTFLVWAVMSKVIVGKFIPALGGTVTGQARTSLEQQFGGAGVSNRLTFLGKQVFGMQPLLVVGVGLLVGFVLLRRDWRGLVPIATFGGSLSVDVVQLVQGASFDNLRYFLTVVPLGVYGFMFLAALPSDRLRPRPRAGWLRGFGRRYGPVVTISSVVALGLAATGPAAGAVLIKNRNIAIQEEPWYDAALHGDAALPGPDVSTWPTDRAAAAAVDALDTAPGTVLVDAGAASAVLAGSRDRDKWLANADRTWEASVADPVTRHIRYLLMSGGTGLAGDAIFSSFPGVYDNGGGIATLVGQYGGWKLFHLTSDTIPNRTGEENIPVQR